jgi:hypothetical protein
MLSLSKTKVDCIEEIVIKESKLVTMYRTRFMSKYLNRMVEISGKNGLHPTVNQAIHYYDKWCTCV